MNEKLYVVEGGTKRSAEYVSCGYCGVSFLKASYNVKRSTKHYCTKTCYLKAKQARRVIKKCAYCGQDVVKTISDLVNSRSGLYFCNRECKEAAQKERMPGVTPDHYYDHETGKRGKTYKPNLCAECGKKIARKSIKCIDCYREYISVENKTKADIFENSTYWTAARATISKHARKIYAESGKPTDCFICGYNHYTEICHIKNVADFTDNTLLSEINDIRNLIALCPNHHKEFDDGVIQIDAE